MSGSVTSVEVIEQVLRSKTFAASPSSRRLLKYLAERTSVDDPELKEYSVGVDVFGKLPSYDPQRDSTVRVQVGRLRQRLAEYYKNEGQYDSIVLDIPKGGFRLAATTNPRLPEPVAQELAPAENPPERPIRWQLVAGMFASISLALIGWIFLRPGPTVKQPGWSAALESIWHPLVASPRPLLIAYSAPMFIELQGTMIFRDRGEENWERALASDRLQAIRRALGDPHARETHYYAAAGEVGASFALARALGSRKAAISLVRDVELSWQQLADNDVIFLGPPRFFRDRLGNLPMELEILAAPDQFRVAHPRPGEPVSFSKEGVQGDGEAFVLVTHGPGPTGKGSIFSFMSNDTFARQGAVQAFTDPEAAGPLIAGLRDAAGRLPSFYQVMLQAKLKSGVTTEIKAVLHRPLGERR